MTEEELKEFEREWIREAEIELSSSMERDCRLGFEWDRDIFRTYRNILLDLFGGQEITKDEYDKLIGRINIRHPEDDYDAHREIRP